MALTRIPHRRHPCDATTISSLDPLGADYIHHGIPAMNAAADVPALVRTLRWLIPPPDRLASFSFNECLAAVRDLGLPLGSIKRHGQEPVRLVPEVEPVLLELAQRTDMIPRDTVHHYTEWNPTDRRQRMFTGDRRETFLMNSVRDSMPRVADAIEICTKLSELDLGQPEFITLLGELDNTLGVFSEAVAMVIEKVTAEFFARGIRPYYEGINVAGRGYLGPAAAHIPLFLVDLALWASDHGDQAYADFIDEVVPHTLPQWRTLVPAWSRVPSLVTRIANAYEARTEGGPAREVAVALAKVLRTVLLFRGKHLTIARKAYQVDLRLYELGSGGGSIALLQQILDLTRANASLVRNGSRSPAAQVANG